MSEQANDGIGAEAAGRIEAALERLVELAERAAPRAGVPREDAIARIRGGPARTSAVRSLRDDPVLERFRQEATDGLIRADTALRLLDLVTRIVEAVRA